MQVSVGKMQSLSLSPPNILVFGPVGAGKSSFIRSLLEVVEGDSEAGSSVTTGKGEGSVTKTLNAYAVKTSQGAHVCTLWDAAGIEGGKSSTLYKDGVMAHLLMGRFPEGTALTGKLDDRTAGYRPTPTEGQRIHGVVMCIAAAEVSDDSCAGAIAEFTSIVRDRNIPHLLVITKADEHDPNLLDGGVCGDDLQRRVPLDMRHIYRSNAIRKLLEKADKTTGFSQVDMAPLANKTKQDVGGIGVPKACLLLGALRKIIRKTEEYRKRTAAGVMDPVPPPPPPAPAPPRSAAPSEASFVLVTPSPSVAPSPQPAGDKKTITEALIMICQELHVPHPPDVDLKSALKGAQEYLGQQPDGNMQAQVMALVSELGINVPGWTDR
jgi:GTPase SAR1 family protein